MSMMPIYFTTSRLSKRKKKKFSSAEAAKKARENQKNWDLILKKYPTKESSNLTKKTLHTPLSYRGRDFKIPSLESTWDPCVKPADKVYTGNAIVGIATMHKSNAVPVFSKEEAITISKMRR